MPGEFNALGEGGLNELLLRRLAITGGPPSGALEPALFPALVLENDRVEWGYLKGELTYGWRGSIGAGVGRSSAELFNPSRDTLAVVRMLQGSVATGNLYAKLLVYAQGAAGTPLPTDRGYAMDGRNALSGSGVRGSGLYIEENTIAAAKGGSIQLQVVPGQVYSNLFVLPPFTSLYVYQSNDAASISYINLVWSERQAEQRELA